MLNKYLLTEHLILRSKDKKKHLVIYIDDEKALTKSLRNHSSELLFGYKYSLYDNIALPQF